MTPTPPSLTHVAGDLVDLARAGRFDVIAHGCNCFCTMGKGLALTIKRSFPAAWAADQATRSGDRAKLGTCTAATIDHGGRRVTVVNAYTQFDFRGRGVRADYQAIASCLRWIRSSYPGQRLGLPRIGAGLAGGDWSRIADIIAEVLASEQVTIVDYDGVRR